MNATSINIQGNIISSEIIEKIRSEDPGFYQQVGYFGINHALRDEIGNAWINARALWNIFKSKKDRLKDDDSGTTETRKSWLEPLLAELSFSATKATVYTHPESGKRFEISHKDEEIDGFPIHLVSFKQSLDKGTKDGKSSPHALLQEYLNKVENTYGLASNGIFLRLLRDSSRIVRISYFEFNLEKMMEEDLYSDFAILYRTLHASRFELKSDYPDGCIFESYHLQSLESGSRLRENLSIAVINALVGYPNGIVLNKQQPFRTQVGLANGFIQNPHNETLREQLKNNKISAEGYYAELLRLIYRFLFLIVTEERDLVYPETADDDILYKKRIYYQYYSIERLRKLAGKMLYFDNGKDDLWEGMKSTFMLFESKHFGSKLGIQALASGIFAPSALNILMTLRLDNRVLIDTIAGLCYFVNNETQQTVRVNYSDLDVEEFGSVYEGLLEYSPNFSFASEIPHFHFKEGSFRGISGSHYTPEELCKPLIQHSLDHVIEEKIAQAIKDRTLSLSRYTNQERETAIKNLLGIQVIDVACGSGHLLLSAARRIATEVARLMTTEEQPNPVAMRHAMRAVIKNCIYGVDKNPLAVELCKVALWLEAHNPGEPLNFLDHHIKCGDSIVGLALQKEILAGVADEAFKPTPEDNKELIKQYRASNKKGFSQNEQIGLFENNVNESLTELINQFSLLDYMPEGTAEEVADKEQQYRVLIKSPFMKRLKMLADIQVAQFFIPKTDANKDVIVTNVGYFEFLRGGQIPTQLTAGIDELISRHNFFHWFLEFPEVFNKGGFDCILGNPPFLGGQKLSGAFGNSFLEYVKFAYKPAGAVDLVTYFFRRIFTLLRPNGFQSLVSTNTIAQGGAREGGLDVICGQDGVINHAVRSMKWPGDAAVEVSLITIHKGAWQKDRFLDKKKVGRITPYLDDSEVIGNPYPLKQNAGKSFQGSIVLGKGFVLAPEEAKKLIEKDSRNRDVLFPYLNGEDLNNDPDQRPSRWVINFFDWSKDKAMGYPDCFAIIEHLVKPERMKQNDKGGKEKWWQFLRPRNELYETISKLDQVMAINRHAKYLLISVSPKDIIYSEATVVLAIDSYFYYAILSSSFHDAWAWKNSSTMGAATLRYSSSKAFETFPFPAKDFDPIQEMGIGLAKLRQTIMNANHIGLTETYNFFHNKDLDLSNPIYNKIVELRQLHCKIDEAVLLSYGWEDIPLKHGFYEMEYLPENDWIRFAIHPSARKEILKRLSLLNSEHAGNQTTTKLLGKKKSKFNSSSKINNLFTLPL
jgi:hypothetical protein